MEETTDPMPKPSPQAGICPKCGGTYRHPDEHACEPWAKADYGARYAAAHREMADEINARIDAQEAPATRREIDPPGATGREAVMLSLGEAKHGGYYVASAPSENRRAEILYTGDLVQCLDFTKRHLESR